MLLEIGLSLLIARVLHIAFEKLKQPAVIGEILTGVLLGPYVGGLFGINVLSEGTGEVFEGLAKIGIILLLFISGLEIGLEELKSVGKKGIVTSLFDVSVAFLFGFLAGKILGLSFVESIAIGNILVATSVGITVRTLLDMDKLHTRVGELILTVAVLDDVLGILVLSITLGTGESILDFLRINKTATLLMSVVVFFMIFVLSLIVIDKLKRHRFYIPRLITTASLSGALIYAAIAKLFGLAAITGSFFAGLTISKLSHKDRIKECIRSIADIFFVPLFFVWVGASFDFSALGGLGTLVAIVIPMALVGKVIGCSLGSRICGYTNREALAVGVGMIPRMEIALVVVTAEITMNIFRSPALAHQILAATILLVIISSLITPPLLKAVYPKEN
ncbi:MAG: cation:proton antiporter [Thermoplasmata archaeon]|nr:MAG: cation:proton antiporter [Thermoplasmata archaeon]KAA0016333.1 MAG: cation:proton antiporter [Thermoplasmata archaeon]